MAGLGLGGALEGRPGGGVCGAGRGAGAGSRRRGHTRLQRGQGLGLAPKPQSAAHGVVRIMLWVARLSALETYFIPKDGSLASYKEYVSMLPTMDPPEAFGQHPNADVASQITEARTLFETLLSLQPQITPTRAGGQSREEKVGRGGCRGRGGSGGAGRRGAPPLRAPARVRSSSWLRM